MWGGIKCGLVCFCLLPKYYKHLQIEEQLRKVTANPPCRGGGWAVPFQSPADGGRNRFPPGKDTGNCPTFCPFSLHCTSPSPPHGLLCQEGPCWPSTALGTRLALLFHWDTQGQPSRTLAANSDSLGNVQQNSVGWGSTARHGGKEKLT